MKALQESSDSSEDESDSDQSESFPQSFKRFVPLVAGQGHMEQNTM